MSNMWVCAYECRFLRSSEKDIGSPGARVIGKHELPCGYWALNPSPL